MGGILTNNQELKMFHGGRVDRPSARVQNHFFDKNGIFRCILQSEIAICVSSSTLFVAKIQKINLIGCHLLLKSVNFFIFRFQNLNIRGCLERLL
jgi:hypothetical protein